MNQQEPLEREELQKAQDSTEPVKPTPQVNYIDHRDGLVEPTIKEYLPLQVGMVIFSIVILVVFFVGTNTNMWGLGN